MMKRTLLLTLSAFIAFTSCTKAANKQGGSQGNLVESAIAPDEKVKEIMGDSIAAIVFNPRATMIAYRMAPTETPTDNDRTIGGVKVGKVIGRISKAYLPVMQFLLSDSASYNGEELVPAIPFKGTIALEFKLRKESVFLLYSFVSREISTVKNGKEVWHRHISDMRKYTLFFYHITKDDELEFYLQQQ